MWREELRWGGSFQCAHCGSALEMDGRGPLDPEMRGLLLSAEGMFCLVVEENGTRARVRLFCRWDEDRENRGLMAT